MLEKKKLVKFFLCIINFISIVLTMISPISQLTLKLQNSCNIYNNTNFLIFNLKLNYLNKNIRSDFKLKQIIISRNLFFFTKIKKSDSDLSDSQSDSNESKYEPNLVHHLKDGDVGSMMFTAKGKSGCIYPLYYFGIARSFTGCVVLPGNLSIDAHIDVFGTNTGIFSHEVGFVCSSQTGNCKFNKDTFRLENRSTIVDTLYAQIDNVLRYHYKEGKLFFVELTHSGIPTEPSTHWQINAPDSNEQFYGRNLAFSLFMGYKKFKLTLDKTIDQDIRDKIINRGSNRFEEALDRNEEKKFEKKFRKPAKVFESENESESPVSSNSVLDEESFLKLNEKRYVNIPINNNPIEYLDTKNIQDIKDTNKQQINKNKNNVIKYYKEEKIKGFYSDDCELSFKTKNSKIVEIKSFDQTNLIIPKNLNKDNLIIPEQQLEFNVIVVKSSKNDDIEIQSINNKSESAQVINSPVIESQVELNIDDQNSSVHNHSSRNSRPDSSSYVSESDSIAIKLESSLSIHESSEESIKRNYPFYSDDDSVNFKSNIKKFLKIEVDSKTVLQKLILTEQPMVDNTIAEHSEEKVHQSFITESLIEKEENFKGIRKLFKISKKFLENLTENKTSNVNLNQNIENIAYQEDSLKNLGETIALNKTINKYSEKDLQKHNVVNTNQTQEFRQYFYHRSYTSGITYKFFKGNTFFFIDKNTDIVNTYQFDLPNTKKSENLLYSSIGNLEKLTVKKIISAHKVVDSKQFYAPDFIVTRLGLGDHIFKKETKIVNSDSMSEGGGESANDLLNKSFLDSMEGIPSEAELEYNKIADMSCTNYKEDNSTTEQILKNLKGTGAHIKKLLYEISENDNNWTISQNAPIPYDKSSEIDEKTKILVDKFYDQKLCESQFHKAEMKFLSSKSQTNSRDSIFESRLNKVSEIKKKFQKKIKLWLSNGENSDDSDLNT